MMLRICLGNLDPNQGMHPEEAERTAAHFECAFVATAHGVLSTLSMIAIHHVDH